VMVQRKAMKKLVNRFIQDESGGAAIEYALIAGILVTAIVAALTAFSPSLSTTFTNLGTSMSLRADGK
ncbi:MAG TPA: Flp family type IVb pilin, partial [Chthoniobacterales bacterium]